MTSIFPMSSLLSKYSFTVQFYVIGELTENSDNMIFNLMNFNMLSQYLLLNHKELYWMNDPKTLKWEFRWQLLFEEIQSQKPDVSIFCTHIPL